MGESVQYSRYDRAGTECPEMGIEASGVHAPKPREEVAAKEDLTIEAIQRVEVERSVLIIIE